MIFKTKTRARKIASLLSAVMLLIQAFSPYFVGQSLLTPTVQGQELTPTATVAPTPTKSVTPTETVTPTVTPAATVTATPTATLTPAPTDSEVDTSSEENSQESESTESSEETSEPENTPTPSPEPTSDVEGDIVTNVIESAQCFENSINGCNAQVTTDKEDYAPTEHVFVTGTNFEPNTEYTLVIFSNDEPATRFETIITTNEVGAFSISYELDGIYRPDYQIDVFDEAGALVATVTFTDSASPGVDLYQQCSNDEGEGYSTGNTGCRWINGNLQQSNSRYYEGDATPQRLVLQDLVSGNYTLTITYGTTKGGKHAYDFLTDDKFSESWIANSDFCEGISKLGDCSTLTPELSDLIPTDPNASGHDVVHSNRHFKIWNGTWVGGGIVSGPTLTSGSYAGDSDTSIQVQFSVDSNTCTNGYNAQGDDLCAVLITWGAHVSTQEDWGVGNSAIDISGSPYHVALASLNGGAIGSRDNQMQASAVLPSGSITIIKDAQPNSDHDFEFTTTGDNLNNFTLDDDDDADPTLSNTAEFIGLNNGNYSITEAEVDGWTLSSITCTDADQATVGDVTGNTVSIDLQPGQDVTCTFVNTQDVGNITVIKDVDPNDVSTWDIDIAGGTPSSYTLSDGGSTGLQEVVTGDYVITEAAAVGTDGNLYNSAYSCVDVQGAPVDSGPGRTINLTVSTGDDITCTFTNTRKTGQIKIVKNTSGDDGTFDYAIEGPSVGSPQISTTGNIGDTGFLTVDSGEYSVTETIPASWKLETASCADAQGVSVGSFAGNAVSGIQVNDGDQVICTFENTRLRDITACKYEDVNGDRQRQEDEPLLSGWNITLTDENDSETSLPTEENGCVTFSDLEPGDYSLAETLKDNWTNKTPLSTDVVLSSSSNETVYFGNFECSTISGKKWHDLNGNGIPDEGEPVLPNWPIYLSGESTDQDATDPNGNYSFNVCVGGDHTVSEGTLDAETWYQTYPAQNGDYDLVVESGQTYEDNDFGNAQYASISGFKYRDNDGDGTLDADDLVDTLAGWVFDLYDGLTDSIVATSVATLSDGFYSFTGLLAGQTYYVLERVETGWTQTVGPTSPSPSPVTLESGDDIEIDFGNFENVSVKVCKIEDADGDAQTINDQTPVIGWTVHLLIDDQIADTQQTLASEDRLENGCYTWVSSEELPLGPGHTYGVSEEVPNNWVALGDTTHSFVPATSGSEYSHTFVNYELGGISGVKYNDINGNGTPDDEPVLPDWTIFIDENGNEQLDNGEESRITDGSGAYSFTGLNPGTYSVCEVAKAGWLQTSSPTCHTVPLVSGQDSTGNDFGNQGQGSIKVVKNVDVDGIGGVDGEVTDYPELNWEWYLDGDVDGYTSSATVPVVAGVYDITESGIIDFSFTSLVCDTQDPETEADYETDGNSAEVTVNPGDNITCTYVNTRDTGRIVVNKAVDVTGTGDYLYGSEGNLLANTLGFAWGLGDETSGREMGTDQIVVTGTYDLTEADVDNYTFEGWFEDEGSCEDLNEGDPEIQVASGETVEVTFCNSRDTGTVIIQKATVPSQSQEEFNFELLQGETTINTFSLIDGQEEIHTNLLAGLEYSVSEEDVDDDAWDLTSVQCSKSEKITEGVAPPSVDSTGFNFIDGETVTCIFTNTQRANVAVTKYHDRNVNGVPDEGEEELSGWEINLGEETETSDGDGEVLFANILPGTYELSENLEEQEGWNLSVISCYDGEVSTNENGLELDLNPDDEINCEIGNYTTGDVTVTKIQDNDGDLETTNDQTILGGWQFILNDNPAEDLTDEEFGSVVFSNLEVGEYVLTEEQKAGYRLVGMTCTDGESVVGQEGEDSYFIDLLSQDDISCEIYNQPTDPVLTIEKLNDSTSTETAGNQVVYTLRLTVSEDGGPSLNTIVTDLTPEGFEYVAGSYSATKNGSAFSVSEPTYASPGNWDLGDLEPGDVVEMFYTVDISNDQDSGLYPDLAWAIGESTGGSEVLADAGTDGNIGEESFVGTDVEINVDDIERVGVDVEEEVEGDVLGASTLPATGANTIWMLLALVLASLGLLSMGAGYMLVTGRSNKLKKVVARVTKTVTIIALACVVTSFAAQDAHAATGTSVRIETPADTSDKEFEVNFVYLDIENRTASLICLQKGPDDGAYTQFDSTKNLQAGGDNGSCQVDSDVIDKDGTYLFKVNVTPNGGSALESDVVSADINTEAPGTPTNYSKSKVNSCKYKIRFRTANDDGLTNRVEIYRSDLTSFNADAGSRIHEQSAGSNELIEYTDEVSDCDKTWYYAVRAFSSTNAGSGVIGDSVTVTVSGSTTTSSEGTAEGEETLGAIPVGGASTTAGGDDAGDEAAEDGETDEDTTDEGEAGDEEVLGAASDAGLLAQIQGFFSNPYAIGGVIAVIILAIIGYGIKKRRS